MHQTAIRLPPAYSKTMPKKRTKKIINAQLLSLPTSQPLSISKIRLSQALDGLIYSDPVSLIRTTSLTSLALFGVYLLYLLSTGHFIDFFQGRSSSSASRRDDPGNRVASSGLYALRDNQTGLLRLDSEMETSARNLALSFMTLLTLIVILGLLALVALLNQREWHEINRSRRTRTFRWWPYQEWEYEAPCYFKMTQKLVQILYQLRCKKPISTASPSVGNAPSSITETQTADTITTAQQENEEDSVMDLVSQMRQLSNNSYTQSKIRLLQLPSTEFNDQLHLALNKS